MKKFNNLTKPMKVVWTIIGLVELVFAWTLLFTTVTPSNK